MITNMNKWAKIWDIEDRYIVRIRIEIVRLDIAWPDNERDIQT